MKLIAQYAEDIFEIAYNLKEGKFNLKDLTSAIEKKALEKAEDKINKTKGDLFEIFAYMFFNAFRNDPSVGLVEYTPIDIEEDYGVDGTGVNANKQKVAVQIKYRRNPKDLVLYSEIARTFTSGRLNLKLDLEYKNSIYVFTNANGVTPTCEKVFGNIVKALNNNGIDHYIRNNYNFWKFFYEKVKRNLS